MTTKQRTPQNIPHDFRAPITSQELVHLMAVNAALLAALRMAMNAWALHKLETEPWHDVARAAIAAVEKG